MGNCIVTYFTLRQAKSEEAKEEEAKGDGVAKEGGLKVKILLTRGELERLMAQLKEEGERKLEDVLMEIGKEREREERRDGGWRPTLESITEIPEVQSINDQ